MMTLAGATVCSHPVAGGTDTLITTESVSTTVLTTHFTLALVYICTDRQTDRDVDISIMYHMHKH